MTNTAPSSGELVLAPELWELVFRHVDDDDIFPLATACPFFSGIAGRVALDVFGDGQDILLDEHIRLDSRTLHALDLTTKNVAAHSIAASMDPASLHRDLSFLGRTLNGAANVQKLDIELGCDILGIPLDHGSRARLLRALSAALAVVARRAKGPAVVLSPTGVFACDPTSVRDWNLHRLDGQFAATVSERRRAARARFDEKGLAWDELTAETEGTLRGGRPGTVSRISEIERISVEYVPDGPVLVLFNPLQIDRSDFYPVPHRNVDDEILMAILAHASFPALQSVSCGLGLGSALLALMPDFLLRHPDVQNWLCSDFLANLFGAPTYSPAPPTPTSMFPPIAHPRMHQISTEVNWNLDALATSAVAALAASPCLAIVSIRVPLHLPRRLHALMLEDFRIMAALPRLSRLTLTLREPAQPGVVNGDRDDADWKTDGAGWLAHPELLALAPHFQPLRTLRLETASSADAESLLPWVERLPGLQSLEVSVTHPMNMEVWLARAQKPSEPDPEAGNKEAERVKLAETVRQRVGDTMQVWVSVL